MVTRSTFRPPPFVSIMKDAGYPMPSYPMPSYPIRGSHQTAPPAGTHDPPDPTHPLRTPHRTSGPFSHPADNDSLAWNATLDDDGDWLGWWNLSDGSNLTTASSLTSSLTSAEPSFPAGYPSGYTWPHIIVASVLVTVIMLIIIVGNFLVIWAIVRDRNLKGTQNYFIGSLALADFLLGLLIVPFSLANELMGYWHFGAVFCEVWKAVDVLLCTASISSLCLISLDRYWSITKAIHYSRQRTPKRAAIMIFVVWFVSAAICIPPLIGWNQPVPDSDWPVCALSEDIGYVLYSSMGSFYIPAFIMVFVYFKIYQAAKARARKNVSRAPRSAVSEKSEQKNSTESSGTDQAQQQHHHHQHQHHQLHQQHQHHELSEQKVAKRQDVIMEEGYNNQLKVHPLQSSSVDEVELLDEEEEGEGALQQAPMLASSHCRCANDILDDSVTPVATSEDESCRQVLDFRARSLSLPCRAGRGDELTKLLSTDSDSCDALAGPVLNRMDRSRLGFYSMPTTTTTDTDSSLDLPPRRPPPPSPLSRSQLSGVQSSHSGSRLDPASPTVPESPVHTPLHASAGTLMSQSSIPPFPPPSPPSLAPSKDNGTMHQFRIVEPKQNGSCDRSEVSTPDLRPPSPGLLGSLQRRLFPHRQADRPRPPGRKKAGHKKAGGPAAVSISPRGEESSVVGGGGGGGRTVDFFSAERHKRKLAKARERRATLVLGLVMAAFILCWLPFFLLYVASAFCEGCIPIMVFTVFFWIGYCNSALNPIIYTVFNRDFRRAFHRILFGRARPGRR